MFVLIFQMQFNFGDELILFVFQIISRISDLVGLRSWVSKLCQINLISVPVYRLIKWTLYYFPFLILNNLDIQI